MVFRKYICRKEAIFLLLEHYQVSVTPFPSHLGRAADCLFSSNKQFSNQLYISSSPHSNNWPFSWFRCLLWCYNPTKLLRRKDIFITHKHIYCLIPFQWHRHKKTQRCAFRSTTLSWHRGDVMEIWQNTTEKMERVTPENTWHNSECHRLMVLTFIT